MTYLPFTRPTVDEATIQGVIETLRSGWLASGPQVQRFEQALSDYLGGRYARTFTSATAALEVALQLCNIGSGDEVITPALSFVATANVILRVGAKPVFVDVDLKTRNIDLDQAEAAITEKTRAIMPVHFAGLPVDMQKLYTVADRNNLRVIEDAAHAIGSSWHGKKIGSFGDIVCFSFHPNKNMTTIEGGALVTSNAALAQQVERLRFHGIEKDEYGNMDVLAAGGKFNLPDVSARVGISQLAQLDAFNLKRRQLAEHYLTHWKIDAVLPENAEGHSWHMFAPLIDFENCGGISRTEFIAEMHRRNIGVGIHYPAIHLFTLYRSLGYSEGNFPNAERIGAQTVTLPLFPAMTMNDVMTVCDTAAEIINQAKR